MKIVEMNNPQQNEADIVGGIKKFFRKLPGSAEKAESKFTNQLIQSITKALQRAEDFNLLAPQSTNYAQGNYQQSPANVTYGQQRPQTSTQPVATPAATPQPTSRAEPTVPPPEPQASQPLTFGGKKYTKGPRGWVDDKGKPADVNTSKILDQAQAKANQPAATPKPAATSTPKPASSITTGPNNKMAIKGLQMREDAYFEKLNDLFEGIITLQEGNLSVSDFITNRWFGPWARSIAAKNPEVDLLNPNVLNQVKTLAREIESSYARDKGNKAIRKLADYLTNTYYDIVNQVGGTQTSTPQASQQVQPTPVSQQTQPAQVSSPSSSSSDMSSWAKRKFGSGGTYDLDDKKVEQYFDTLYQRDPNSVNKLIKKLVQKYRVI